MLHKHPVAEKTIRGRAGIFRESSLADLEGISVSEVEQVHLAGHDIQIQAELWR